MFWSDELFDILEFPRGAAPPLEQALALYPDPWRTKVAAALTGCAQHGTPIELEVEIHTATGARKWVHLSAEAEREADGSISQVRGALQDITERKQLDQQYLRAQRMESIGTLSSGIAHDLNNVLAPIMMSIGLLQEGEDDQQRLQILSAIEGAMRSWCWWWTTRRRFGRLPGGRSRNSAIA